MPGIQFLAVLEFVEGKVEAIRINRFFRVFGSGLLLLVLCVGGFCQARERNDERHDGESQSCFSHECESFLSSILQIRLPTPASCAGSRYRKSVAPVR